MTVYHPTTVNQRLQRDALLAATLRPDGAQFPIASEYPIVLSESGSKYSFCLGAPEAPVAHANLWPRHLISQTHDTVLRVGLVGNVASAAQQRGKGHMRTLFTELKAVALTQGLEALILWSDLLEFYQKLDFKSCGRELRWQFSRDRLNATLPSRIVFKKTTSRAPEYLKQILRSRYRVPYTIERSPEEFVQLLNIPDMSILATATANPAYVIVGKGCDMTCVVHEWGAPDPMTLLSGVLAAAEAANLKEILLLTPVTLTPTWLRVLKGHASQVGEHNMALAWWPDASLASDLLPASFIWGLDSI